MSASLCTLGMPPSPFVISLLIQSGITTLPPCCSLNTFSRVCPTAFALTVLSAWIPFHSGIFMTASLTILFKYHLFRGVFSWATYITEHPFPHCHQFVPLSHVLKSYEGYVFLFFPQVSILLSFWKLVSLIIEFQVESFPHNILHR